MESQPSEDPTPAMTGSMSLDGDVGALAAYYGQWAEEYDLDVAEHEYGLPGAMLSTLQRVIDANTDLAEFADASTIVLDAGCGTGLVGEVFHAAGYAVVDGVDLSPQMVAVARRRGCYRKLEGGIDLTEPVPAHLLRQAQVVTVAGVFTVGHVPPESLAVMATLVTSGGLLIVSTRDAYYRSTNFQEVSDQLVADGVLDLLLRIDDGPYTMDSTAHYWAYRVR